MSPSSSPPEGEVRAQVSRVPPRLLIKPDAFHLSTVRGAAVTSIKIHNLTKRDVPLLSAACDIEGGSAIPKGLAKTIPSGQAIEIELFINTERVAKVGPIKGIVKIRTGLPDMPHSTPRSTAPCRSSLRVHHFQRPTGSC